MAIQQQAHPGHAFPWWLELVAAGMIGAAILFGILLIAGHSDLLPSTSTTPTAEAFVMSDYRAGEIGTGSDTRDLGLYLQRQEEIGAIQR